jgi:hypothetical protein
VNREKESVMTTTEPAQILLQGEPATGARKKWSKPRVIKSDAERTSKIPYANETTPGGISYGPS